MVSCQGGEFALRSVCMAVTLRRSVVSQPVCGGQLCTARLTPMVINVHSISGLYIIQAFPCRCKLHDPDVAAATEQEVGTLTNFFCRKLVADMTSDQLL